MRLLPAVLLFAVGCGSGASAPEDMAAPPDLAPTACELRDEQLKAAVDGLRIDAPNAMLAVKDEACGVKVLVSGDPATATADSLFRIGSVSKTYVAAVIQSLAEEAKLSLDDPLSKWVANVPQTTGVTVRMLLNHTSGIFNYTEDPDFFVDRMKKWTPREIVDLATANPPYFAPGADYHYSNTNYALLGMIAEAAGGAKLSALIKARATGKAGLQSTFLDGEEPLVGTLARGFAGTTDVTYVADPSGPWAAGAMVATGADLVEWATALYATDKVLSQASRTEMVAMPASGGTYGLGVIILSKAMTGGLGYSLGHNGAIDGFRTVMLYFPAQKLAVAAVANRGSAEPFEIVQAAAPILFP